MNTWSIISGNIFLSISFSPLVVMMSFAFNVRNHAQRCDKKFTWLNDHIFHLQTVRWPKGSSFYLLRSRIVFPRYKEQRAMFSATIYFQSTRRRLSFLLLFRDTLIFTEKAHTSARVFFSRSTARHFIAAQAGVECLAVLTHPWRVRLASKQYFTTEGFTFLTPRRKCLGSIFYIMAYHKTNTDAGRVACVTSKSFVFVWAEKKSSQLISRELFALSGLLPKYRNVQVDSDKETKSLRILIKVLLLDERFDGKFPRLSNGKFADITNTSIESRRDGESSERRSGRERRSCFSIIHVALRQNFSLSMRRS